MNCSNCKMEIKNPQNVSENSLDVGIKLTNNKWYCQLCADNIDLIDDFKPDFEINILKEKIKPKEILKEQIINTHIFICKKCDKKVNGTKCLECGMISPLYKRPNNKNKK